MSTHSQTGTTTRGSLLFHHPVCGVTSTSHVGVWGRWDTIRKCHHEDETNVRDDDSAAPSNGAGTRIWKKCFVGLADWVDNFGSARAPTRKRLRFFRLTSPSLTAPVTHPHSLGCATPPLAMLSFRTSFRLSKVRWIDRSA